GIGATYAKRLAARGYDLILVARDQGRLTTLADALAKQHDIRVTVMAADLTHEQDLQRVESELANNAQITLLLNNAGMGVEGEFLEADITRINT
ncbi:SDR family NAD(P)-dependent oxidoreductase, partial [Variovorax sp. 2RAF20]